MFRYSLFLLVAFTSLSMMASAQSFNVHLDIGRGGGHYHGNQICRSNRCGYQVNRDYQRYRPVARCGTDRYYGHPSDRRYRKRWRKQYRRQNRRYRNNYRCR